MGWQAQVRGPVGNATVTYYAPASQQVTTVDAADHPSYYYYDADGRLYATTDLRGDTVY